MADSNNDYSTVIGPDAHFKGELQFEKGVRLLGKFEGQVTTKGELVVAEGANLQGEVSAGNIRLDGEVNGNLRASGKVHLTASAKLEGDLTTNRLEVSDGAVFIGRCVVGTNGKTGATPAAKPNPVEAAKPRPMQASQPVGAKK
ncbi:MAG: polymer-forming cytoskeletal protein [Phycisphaerae bacterium]